MIDYRVLSVAEEEAAEASSFYNEASPGIGIEFLRDLRHAINRLREFPSLGTPIDDDLRGLVMSRFPFKVIYYVEPDAIVIVSVAHQSRRPDYWRARIN